MLLGLVSESCIIMGKKRSRSESTSSSACRAKMDKATRLAEKHAADAKALWERIDKKHQKKKKEEKRKAKSDVDPQQKKYGDKDDKGGGGDGGGSSSLGEAVTERPVVK